MQPQLPPRSFEMRSRFHRFHSAVSLVFAIGLSIALPPRLQANPQTTNTEQLRLGQSAIPLYGPWKFSIGDSPIDPSTGRLLWAEPEFDDSHWEDVNLTPETGAQNPITGTSNFVPGWTARGHAGYWGYAWYRLRVQIDSNHGSQLAIAGPTVDDAYQAFQNGTMIGHFGDFSSHTPQIYYSQP